MDDTPDPRAEDRCLIALALAEIDATGGPKTAAGALFVLSARVMLAGLAAAAGDVAPRPQQSSPLQ